MNIAWSEFEVDTISNLSSENTSTFANKYARIEKGFFGVLYSMVHRTKGRNRKYVLLLILDFLRKYSK